MIQRSTLAALCFSLAFLGCKDKTTGDGTVTEPVKQPRNTKNQEKTLSPELLTSLDGAILACKTINDDLEPDKVKVNDAYDHDDATKRYNDECKSKVDAVIAADATLASYSGTISGKTYNVKAVKDLSDSIPGRLEIAKTTAEEAAKERKEKEIAEWTPLLKNDRLKVFQEKGKPTQSDAADITPAAISQAKTWIYISAPREDNGKKVVDQVTYKFKKDGKFDGKPKTEVVDYIPPSE